MSTYERVSSNEIEQKKKLITWAACSIFVVLVLTSAISLTTLKQEAAHPKTLTPSSFHHGKKMVSRAVASSNAIASACKSTLYPNACESALASAAGAEDKSPKVLFDISVQFAIGRVHSARTMAYNLSLSHHKHGSGRPSGIDDCLELLDISMEQLNDVLKPKKRSSHHDISTWLSAALTNQATCSESLDTVKKSAEKESMNAQVQSLTQFISNSLALHESLRPRKLPRFVTGGHRRLLSAGWPEWVSAGDRRLLEASPADIRADAVVAQDGSGTHRTIGEAIAFVSLSSSITDGAGGRTVIYVKAGTYKETIRIPTKQKNVMLMGDGKGKSVIVSSMNAGEGSTTYQSATVGAMGAGFIAKGLTIINSAGPSAHQAVALRVGADQSVITQCSIEGYQDTLYTHSNRQFYRDNDIYGTVDFIFGNSAAVIQNCFIQPRKPNGGQKNSITAQGRRDPNQNTGISIQGCKIQGSSDLGGTPTYLGRPWHQYSRVVVMQSSLDGSINSAGWEEWSGSFALSTLYYAEYGNTGPGASTSGRVKWPGVHTSISALEASKFTVSEFIYGDAWLPGTGVDYNAGL